MKLGSLQEGRDGQLIIVKNDLSMYVPAVHIAPTMQTALDKWDQAEPKLRDLAQKLENGEIPNAKSF